MRESGRRCLGGWGRERLTGRYGGFAEVTLIVFVDAPAEPFALGVAHCRRREDIVDDVVVVVVVGGGVPCLDGPAGFVGRGREGDGEVDGAQEENEK